ELTGRDAGSVTSGRAAWWGFFFPGGGSIRPPGFCGGAATGGRAVDLFERAALDAGEKDQPLAARMRPRRLEDMVGQEAVLGPRSALRRAIEQGRIPSLILYGPPGSGKTSLARLIAESSGAHFAQLNAVTSGVADLRRVIEEARQRAGWEADPRRRRTI